MGIGLLQLSSISTQNNYITFNPEITFFKSVYKRYTNYAIEQCPQYFKSSPSFGRKCTVSISKEADLIGRTYIYIELPNIKNENKNSLKQFKWVDNIGTVLVKSVEIEINGEILDRHYGEWIYLWNELTRPLEMKNAIDRMNGNIKSITDFSYEKNSYKLYIPLCFWFCIDNGIALPIISLKNSDIKIHVEFNSLKNCYDTSYNNYVHVNNSFCLFDKDELFYQENQGDTIYGKFNYFDPVEKILYYKSINRKIIIPTTNETVTSLKLTGCKTNFNIYIKQNSVIVNDSSFFSVIDPNIVSSYLLIDCIFLDEYERNMFLKNKIKYLIPVVQNVPEQIFDSNNIIYSLNLYKSSKLLVWVCSLLSNLENKRYYDYSLYPISDKSLFHKSLFTFNSFNRDEFNTVDYYTLLQKYQYKIFNDNKYINMLSFSLDPKSSDLYGSMNFDKIELSRSLVSFNTNVNKKNKVSIRSYSVYYSILIFNNGYVSIN